MNKLKGKFVIHDFDENFEHYNMIPDYLHKLISLTEDDLWKNEIYILSYKTIDECKKWINPKKLKIMKTLAEKFKEFFPLTNSDYFENIDSEFIIEEETKLGLFILSKVKTIQFKTEVANGLILKTEDSPIKEDNNIIFLRDVFHLFYKHYLDDILPEKS